MNIIYSFISEQLVYILIGLWIIVNIAMFKFIFNLRKGDDASRTVTPTKLKSNTMKKSHRKDR